MSDEDQDLLVEYAELEHYIEALRMECPAQPPRLPPGQLPVLRMYSCLRAAAAKDITPCPFFVERLQQELLSSLTTQTKQFASDQKTLDLDRTTSPLPTPIPTSQTPHISTPRPKRELSRRSLLTNSAVAAASLAAGATFGSILTRQANSNPPPHQKGQGYATKIVPDNIPSHWEPIAHLDQLKEEALRFQTEAFAGYIVRYDQDDGQEAGKIVALMATCPHMGCLLQWDSDGRCFACPCHGGLFSKYGDPMRGPVLYLAALPRLETRIQDNQVYVKVPGAGKKA
ncbi:ubiquinol-cytochrome c reductase iron-sulfur subunit [Ktedonobacter racemifer]|uniref:Rieske (2Fe-2S) iron-sulfur domain protein protein n=1 Tax=Ktedonobacter racemifer DSM 44963 TaxID=485913 RepID=D6TGK9_KTERA|nr:Rieske (2Fe-2S) protein [Ktedonobacter racemifer]EFH90721.1 Rieske (2Fe-2S) iron-sulfur domain protein protein [Ktedonobacter racemifer DSM 44963]